MENYDSFELFELQSKQIKNDLDDMLMNREISEDHYNKNLTILAYEYAINGCSDDCILLLLDLKGDYFNSAAILHFEEDPGFFGKCSLIFEVLAFVGHVPYDILTTQKEGKA